MKNKDLLQKLFDSKRECLQVNKQMIKTLGVEAAVLYTYLFSKYIENSENDFLCNVDEIQENFKFSPFKQRTLLNELIKFKLLNIRYGQSRTRYININEDLTVLEKLLYGDKYTKFTSKLINYIVQNIEELYEEEDFDKEDNVYFYNYLSNMNFNKSIKESEKYKNLENVWLSLSEKNKYLTNKNNYNKELVKR